MACWILTMDHTLGAGKRQLQIVSASPLLSSPPAAAPRVPSYIFQFHKEEFLAFLFHSVDDREARMRTTPRWPCPTWTAREEIYKSLTRTDGVLQQITAAPCFLIKEAYNVHSNAIGNVNNRPKRNSSGAHLCVSTSFQINTSDSCDADRCNEPLA